MATAAIDEHRELLLAVDVGEAGSVQFYSATKIVLFFLIATLALLITHMMFTFTDWLDVASPL